MSHLQIIAKLDKWEAENKRSTGQARHGTVTRGAQ